MSGDQFTLEVAAASHAYINLHAMYDTDMHRYGVEELWRRALKDGGVEDCDGYALENSARLLEAEWPRERVKLWICSYVENGEVIGHAVASAEIEGQEWILDNRFNAPMRPRDLLYKWYKVLFFSDMLWHKGPDYVEQLTVTFTPASNVRI